jgi:CBS domain containing-hemolysin-like protein
MILSELIIILLCLAAAAFFEGIETGIFSMHRMRLRHRAEQGDPASRILEKFRDAPDMLISTTLVGSNLCVVIASVVAASMGARLLGIGEALVGGIMTLVVLVFAQYLPKAWFQSQPLRRCGPFAKTLRLSAIILRPAATAINWITEWMVPSSIKESPTRRLFATKDEIDLLAHESAEHGVLSPKQRIMIRRVLELSSKTAADIMIPRASMQTVKASATMDEFFATVRQSTHTRLPVYDEPTRTFSGTVNYFDVVSQCGECTHEPLSAFIRPPLVVPETMPMIEVFSKLRQTRQPVCLVGKSFTEITGLITNQNILDQIVGKA